MNMPITHDEAVACGAAVQAAILNGNQHESLEDTILLDVTPLSLGVTVKGGITSVIIPRNTNIPTKMERSFFTSSHKQTCIKVDVMEGERHMSADNTALGSFVLSGIPEAPQGVEGGDIEFDLDANGILKVTAVNKRAGVKNSITIDAKTSGRLTNKEIDDLIEKAQNLKLDDEKEEKRVSARNKLEELCSKALYDRKVSPSNKRKARECLEWLKNNMFEPQKVFIKKQEKMIKTLEINETLVEPKLAKREVKTVDNYLEEAESAFDDDEPKIAFDKYLAGNLIL